MISRYFGCCCVAFKDMPCSLRAVIAGNVGWNKRKERRARGIWNSLHPTPSSRRVSKVARVPTGVTGSTEVTCMKFELCLFGYAPHPLAPSTHLEKNSSFKLSSAFSPTPQHVNNNLAAASCSHTTLLFLIMVSTIVFFPSIPLRDDTYTTAN